MGGKNPRRLSRHRWCVPPCRRSAAAHAMQCPCAQAALPRPPRPSALKGERHSVGGPANGKGGIATAAAGTRVVTGVLVVQVVKARSPHPSRCCAAPRHRPEGSTSCRARCRRYRCMPRPPSRSARNAVVASPARSWIGSLPSGLAPESAGPLGVVEGRRSPASQQGSPGPAIALWNAIGGPVSAHPSGGSWPNHRLGIGATAGTGSPDRSLPPNTTRRSARARAGSGRQAGGSTEYIQRAGARLATRVPTYRTRRVHTYTVHRTHVTYNIRRTHCARARARG